MGRRANGLAKKKMMKRKGKKTYEKSLLNIRRIDLMPNNKCSIRSLLLANACNEKWFFNGVSLLNFAHTFRQQQNTFNYTSYTQKFYPNKLPCYIFSSSHFRRRSVDRPLLQKHVGASAAFICQVKLIERCVFHLWHKKRNRRREKATVFLCSKLACPIHKHP